MSSRLPPAVVEWLHSEPIDELLNRLPADMLRKLIMQVGVVSRELVMDQIYYGSGTEEDPYITIGEALDLFDDMRDAIEAYIYRCECGSLLVDSQPQVDDHEYFTCECGLKKCWKCFNHCQCSDGQYNS